MADFYFFTEAAKLNPQSVGQAFGPIIDGQPGSLNGKDRYRITSLHSGNNAPAIAVCHGTICFQRDQTGGLTIILKPINQPPFDFPFILYFVYKGIKEDSILAGNSILDENASDANDLTKKAARTWKALNNNDLTDSAEALGLNYNSPFPYDNNGNTIHIFADEAPIRNLFAYNNEFIQLPQVSAGEKIGQFNAQFGFEIIVQHIGYTPSLKLTRHLENMIEVDSLSNPLDDSNPDDYAFFKHWHRKEAALSFVDPTAFYGSFYPYKLTLQTSTGKEKVKNDEIYNEVLNKFLNKHKVWLDLRNDLGFSINYFKNYGYAIQFSESEQSANINEILSHRNLWPVLELEIADVPGLIHNNNLHSTLLRMPRGDIKHPSVFLSKAIVKKLKKLKRKFRLPKVTVIPIDDFLEGFPISFISIEDSGQRKFLANYYRINLYDDRNSVDAVQPSLRLSKSHYLNGIFQPLDINFGINFSNGKFRYSVFHQEIFLNLLEWGGPAYTAKLGIAEDADHITMFAFPQYFLAGKSDNPYMPDAFANWAEVAKTESRPFIHEILDQFKSREARIITLEIEEVPGVIEFIDSIRIRHQNIGLGGDFKHRENPGDFVFIVFKKAGFEQIIQDITSSSDLDITFPIFLTVGNEETRIDRNGKDYKVIILEATGYQKVGNKLEKTSIPLNQKIYEYGDF